MFLKDVLLQKGERKTIKTGWILLDNKFTADMFRKPQLVKNIRYAGGRYIKIHCNSGKRRVTKEANLKDYRAVWFEEGGIANILYFSRIRNNHPVRYHTEGN